MSLINWFYVVPLRLRSIFKRRKADSDLDEELQYHLEMRTVENVSKGMNREEAHRSALLALGGLDQRKEECRDARSISWIYELGRNFSYGLRIAWKQKALSLTVITLLAIACGVNITIFSFYNGLFLRPLPFPDCERLVDLDETAPRWNQESAYIDYTDFNEWRKENRSFDTIAVYNTPARYYSRKSAGIYMDTLAISRSFLAIFRIQPVLGRGFLDDECRPGGLKAAMLGYGFWQREFGGSRSVLGEVIKLDGEAYTVVGVLPSHATFVRKADIWTPLQMSPSNSSRVYFLRGIGLLKKGITLEQAQEDLTRIHKNMIDIRPVNAITSPRLLPLREREFGSYSKGILMFQLAAGALLLIVCANIGGMMLARSESRSREMGIRTALGASRAGIMRQILTESLLLAIPGVILGFLLGHVFLKLTVLWLELENLPPWVRLSADIHIFAFGGLLAAAVTLLFGLTPALQASGVNPQHTLHEGNVRSSANRATRHSMNVLVIGEIALAFVLLVGAGLLHRTWQKLQDVDPGFQVKNLLIIMIDLPRTLYKQPADWMHFFEKFLQRCRQLPGVVDVSGAMPSPVYSGAISLQYFEIEGSPHTAGESDPMIPTRYILPGYFKTMGIPLVSGRVFAENDGRTKGSSVVIVNQSFARRFWPNADPLGKRIRYRADAEVGEWMTVIGLSRDNKEYGLDKATPPAVYYPYNQAPNNAMYLLIRSTTDPAGLAAPIRSQLHNMDPELPIIMNSTASEALGYSLRWRSLLSIIMMLIGISALLIAGIGIYGIVSYGVSRRTHEIGIRMAIGATRSQVLKMMLGGGIRLLIIGAVLGTVASLAVAQALQSELFGVTIFDTPTYCFVGGILAIVVVAASLLPARRAAIIDPMHALRSE